MVSENSECNLRITDDTGSFELSNPSNVCINWSTSLILLRLSNVEVVVNSLIALTTPTFFPFIVIGDGNMLSGPLKLKINLPPLVTFSPSLRVTRYLNRLLEDDGINSTDLINPL